MLKKIFILIVIILLVNPIFAISQPGCSVFSQEETKETEVSREVFIFSMENCAACKILEKLLQKEQVIIALSPYNVVYVDFMKFRKVSKNWRVNIVPQIVIVDNFNKTKAVELARWKWERGTEQFNETNLIGILKKYSKKSEKKD